MADRGASPGPPPTAGYRPGMPSDTDSAPVLSGTLPLLDGTPQPLDAYLGDVVLVVNTASKCGLTPHYEGLEALYRDRQGDGLTVLGFPANDFMEQEPGTDAEIGEFCQRNYGVTFPVFAKSAVTGDDANPLFRALTEQTEAPDWNFTKYLVDRSGRVAARFGARTEPADPALVAEVDRLLAA